MAVRIPPNAGLVHYTSVADIVVGSQSTAPAEKAEVVNAGGHSVAAGSVPGVCLKPLDFWPVACLENMR